MIRLIFSLFRGQTTDARLRRRRELAHAIARRKHESKERGESLTFFEAAYQVLERENLP